MQKFIGQSPWDHRPLIAELAEQIGRELGEPDGVLVFDPSAFKKQGKAFGRRGTAMVLGVWGRSTTARWACIWVMFRASSTPWWTCGCI